MLAVVLSLFLVGTQGQDASSLDLQAQAMDAFHRGTQERDEGRRGKKEFELAASRLLEIQHERPLSPQEMLLQGDAFFLAGDAPRAILSYRQVLSEEPANGQARDRLNWVRAMVGSREPADQDRRAWSAGEIFPVFVMGYTLLWVGVAVWYRQPGGMLGRALPIGGLLLSLATGWFLIQATRTGSGPVVVLAQDQVLLRQGNGPLFPVLGHEPCPRGQEAVLLTQQDGWMKILLPTGESGWVASDAVVTGGSLFPGESQRRVKP